MNFHKLHFVQIEKTKRNETRRIEMEIEEKHLLHFIANENTSRKYWNYIGWVTP